MTASRVTALVLGGALLTSWLVVAGTDRRSALPPPPPASAASPALPAALAANTRRLRVFLEHMPAPREVGRNPFTFAAPPSVRDRRVRAAMAPEGISAPSPPGPPAPPVIRLVAIASDGGTQTAALSIGGELHLVHPGDEVAGRYHVTAVSADAVELVDELGGPTLRLGLR